MIASPPPNQPTPPSTACVIIVCYSARHRQNSVLLVQHAALRTWMTTGGHVDDADDTPEHAAAREFIEEFFGQATDEARHNGDALLRTARQANLWSGPYGRPPLKHMAYILLNGGKVLPTMDRLLTSFVKNPEARAAALVRPARG